jgi:hypothetical protein
MGFEGGPSEEPEDEEVDMDPDEDLPWPNLETDKKNGGRSIKENIDAGYVISGGKRMTNRSLMDALIYGTQTQRAAAALELAVRDPFIPLFETRASGKGAKMELLQ